MTDRIETNKAFLTNLYKNGPFERHGFVSHPALVPAFEGPDNEFTMSERPVKEWVPWVIENYERKVKHMNAVQCDGVPTADISTATHILAAAFGCPVHRPSDTNACALPLVKTAEEADAVEEPDIWSSPSLYRIFELADAVRAELGPDVPLGPPDKQTGFDTACLVWEKTGIYMAMMMEDEKDAVKRLTAKCTHLAISFYKALQQEFPTMSMRMCPGVWAPPDMAPGFSNDECGAFGTDLFEEFCLPELIELSEAFGGLGMHCCAAADHQFPLFRRIPNFYMFNRVLPPGTDMHSGFESLLTHLGGSEGPVHVLGWASDEMVEIATLAAPEGTRFIFAAKGMEGDAAKEWIDRMRQGGRG